MIPNDLVGHFALRLPADPRERDRILGARCGCGSSLPGKYICSECAAIFCRRCAKVVGAREAPICKPCDALCLLLAEVATQAAILEDQHRRFGFADLSLALRYPLRSAITCIGLGAILGATLFSIPFFNIEYVGILLGSIGLLPAFVGVSLMFGCALAIVSHVRVGKTAGGEVFDVLPLLVEIGETVKLGAAMIVALGWPYLAATLLGVSTPAAIALTGVWGLFLYPAVLAVAALTRGFWSVVNPAMLASAAIRMGGVYGNLLLMCLCVTAPVLAIILLIASRVLPQGVSLPLYLTFGVFTGPPLFYADMVTACLVGRALFKSGDRL
ncbi:MAG TPA: hypothetical protein VLZ81_03615 [Blastocatellia bacterium]|nr:hypothetical protein [Blastocatellia bacterium]